METEQHRRLVLMRHAKAEPNAGADRERRLAERGHRDAAEAGEWLAREGLVPDHVLVSSAERARETWETVASSAGWTTEPELDDALYDADPETVLDLVRRVPDDRRVVLVVGHNPTIAFLAQLLDDGEGDTAASTTMAAGHPPGALTAFGYDGAWGDLDHGTARVLAFRSGRG